MPGTSRWFDRTFTFDMPLAQAPSVVERLRGTPARVEELTRGASRERLARRVDGRWSPQEHVGHLLDLEALGLTRLDEFAAHQPRLTAADLGNNRTEEANHNARDLDAILREFRAARMAFVARLDAADDSLWGRTSHHPRLDKPMRLIDLAYFIAEHDDHHLAAIHRLVHRGG